MPPYCLGGVVQESEGGWIPICPEIVMFAKISTFTVAKNMMIKYDGPRQIGLPCLSDIGMTPHQQYMLCFQSVS